MTTRSKTKKPQDAEDFEKISPKKRVAKTANKKSDLSKQIKKQEPKNLNDLKYYHCSLMNKLTGKPCPQKRISHTNIWKHLKTDIHLGKKCLK